MTTWLRADDGLARWIRPGDGIVFGQAAAEPQTLVGMLLRERAACSGARLFLGVNYAGLVRPEHADHLRLSAYCGAGANRALAEAGVLDIYPLPYSQIGGLIRARRIPADVVLLQVPPPGPDGRYSLGLSVEYLMPALETARVVIGEVNARLPRVRTERTLAASDFTALLASDRPPAPLPYGAPGELERRIAAHAAAFVPDRATLEFGLGSLPDAILGALGDRRDLGVHSGAIGDGVADLCERGVITNAAKEIDTGVSIGGVLFGTGRLYRHAHDNPRLELRGVDYTHSARVLGRLGRFVAVNSAVEVDLTGQVNAEVANGVYVGAVGGALDFIRAANQSPGGGSLVLLPSAVGTKVSRIVSRLSGPVSTPRGEAGVFVTEHGAADLRGLPLAARVPRMIAIAHPDFRERLEREAHEQGLTGR